MVIETFTRGADAVGKQLAAKGRMMPEAPDRRTLDEWIARWSDLLDFEVVPVLTSQEFWGLPS